jgi:hypothetical protein
MTWPITYVTLHQFVELALYFFYQKERLIVLFAPLVKTVPLE